MSELKKSANSDSREPVAFVEIDGSLLEGGGQILRLSGSLACLLRKPIRVSKIRANRDRGGLRYQHMHCLRLVNEMHNGELSGAELYSSDISLRPSDPTILLDKQAVREFAVDTKTAASVCLLMQIALPVMLFLPSPALLTLKGGTNASKAPMADYCELVLLPTLAMHFGTSAHLDIRHRGYFPRGGGEVVLSCNPVSAPMPAMELLDLGQIDRIVGHVVVSGKLPKRLLGVTRDAALKILKASSILRGTEINIEEIHKPNEQSAIYIVLVAYTSTNCIIASDIVGERKMRAEKLGAMAASELVGCLESGSCVDEHLMDQLIIFMALASGKSRVLTGPLSLHTETAIHFAKLLTGATFTVEESPVRQGLFEVQCEGIAYEPPTASRE